MVHLRLPSAGQQPEMATEAAQHTVGTKCPRPGGGKLDRQREPIDATADPCHEHDICQLVVLALESFRSNSTTASPEPTPSGTSTGNGASAVAGANQARDDEPERRRASGVEGAERHHGTCVEGESGRRLVDLDERTA